LEHQQGSGFRQGFLHAPQFTFQLYVSVRQLPLIGRRLPTLAHLIGPIAGFSPSRQLLWKHTPAATELPQLLFIKGDL
jgi:hypothetical protein